MSELSQPVQTPDQPFTVKAVKLIPGFSVMIFIGLMGTVEVLIPRFRHLLFQLPFFIAPALVSAWFQYRRAFQPSHVPLTVPGDSPTILKLKKINRRLAWATAAAFCATFAILAGACDCEHHPILTGLAFTPAVAACLGWLCVRQYIVERTRQLNPPLTANRWPGRRLPPSEFKPFYSDHWGENSPT